MVEVTALVSWAVDQGLPLDVEQIFHPATVNRYVQTMEGFAERTRSCRRATLTTVSRRVTTVAPWQPRREVISYKTTKVPYTDTQIRRLIDCAGRQSTPTRVRVLTGVVALGLGAGLTSKEMVDVTGSDVSLRRSHVLIAVPGARPRVVPVLDRYAPTVRELARRAGAGRLIVDSPPRPSYVPEVIARCDIPAALQYVSAIRLRLTWEVLMLRSVPLPVFLRLSGHGIGINVRPLAEHVGVTPRRWTAHEIDVISNAAPW
ncbi:hypothetical protein [Rhodococcus sp. W8901]|uniref:hypothetical protein n=1 Tax=Rhodococcus sp. W8901 TaxID=2742603 RepID=UPI0015831E53|nr:hypothetical protein [Rhodococcus sp. W8901]QKT13232.1 hypothetical protein HUN07_23095 [Rhodococcus sp. W8901]